MAVHLVTGGAGFIGAALCHRLVREGHEVWALDRMSRGKRERLPPEVRVIAGDVRNTTDIDHAFSRSPDVVWHLAYVQGTQTFYADPKDVIDVALRGVMNVLSAIEYCHGVEEYRPDLFLVSSSEVYQNPPAGMYPTPESVPLSVPDVTNPRYSYGGGKIAQELAVLAYQQAGLLNRAVIARPHNIYAADAGRDHVIPQFVMRLADLVAAGTPEPIPFPIQGSGQETRSFCHIDDCIEAFMVLLDHGADRGVYHVGNPDDEFTIAQLAHLVADVLDVEIVVQPGELPKGSPTRRKPAIGKLQALGFEPKVHLREGLRATAEWYVNQARGARA
jgi:nucleoside-diphosphate-sugar epimerase